jgi:hypothetical protein
MEHSAPGANYFVMHNTFTAKDGAPAQARRKACGRGRTWERLPWGLSRISRDKEKAPVVSL